LIWFIVSLRFFNTDSAERLRICSLGASVAHCPWRATGSARVSLSSCFSAFWKRTKLSKPMRFRVRITVGVDTWLIFDSSVIDTRPDIG